MVMSLNNVVVIKEFLPGIFGIFDVNADKYNPAEFKSGNCIRVAHSLREAIKKGQAIENEYGLNFILMEA
jgi:hypothetical protein